MGLATGVWTELRKVREHKAFYAAAGAGDVAAQALRELPERLTRLQSRADLAAWSGRAVGTVIGLGSVLYGGITVTGVLPVAAFVAAAIYLADVRPKVRCLGGGGSGSGPYGPW